MAQGDRFVTEWGWHAQFLGTTSWVSTAPISSPSLVQNDLDQEATRTVLSFEEDRLVCEGDGKPVEADGWQRLRKMQGAGDKAPAKRRKIGIKNHGLKTAFTIGDEFELGSAGQRVVQTLYANGRDRPPYPGASPEPHADPQAPLTDVALLSGIARLISNHFRGRPACWGRSMGTKLTSCSCPLAPPRQRNSPASSCQRWRHATRSCCGTGGLGKHASSSPARGRARSRDELNSFGAVVPLTGPRANAARPT